MENLQLNTLNDEDVQKIHKATLEVLMNPGIRVEHEGALKVFKENGCEVDDETMIVKIPEAVVNKALSTIPPEFTLYSRDGKDIIVLDGFVYAPRYDKRHYVREVESIMYSFEWAGTDKKD